MCGVYCPCCSRWGERPTSGFIIVSGKAVTSRGVWLHKFAGTHPSGRVCGCGRMGAAASPSERPPWALRCFPWASEGAACGAPRDLRSRLSAVPPGPSRPAPSSLLSQPDCLAGAVPPCPFSRAPLPQLFLLLHLSLSLPWTHLVPLSSRAQLTFSSRLRRASLLLPWRPVTSSSFLFAVTQRVTGLRFCSLLAPVSGPF